MKQFKKIFVALLIVLGLGLASCKKDTTLADAKEELNITYTDGKNITLPTSIGEVVITWESNKPAVISNTGVVTKGAEAVEVKLTATLTYKGKTETKYFNINVPKGIVAGAAKAALIEHYKNTLGSATYKVTANIELITTISGVSVTWESDNPNFFSNKGVVTLPTYSQGNQSVSLKATLGDGDTYTFRFNLVALPATTAELIEEALDLVTTKPAGEYQTQDFVVMNKVTIAGVEVPVTWATSDAEGMTAEGKLVVFYEPAEKNVTLTASITYNEVTLTRDVVFKVKSSQKEANFYSALVPANLDKQVMVTNVSYFGDLGTAGFYMVDSEGHLAYFYGTKPANLASGKLYNVIAKVAVYYGTAQFVNFTFNEIEGAANVPAPVETTLAQILALPLPSNTAWNQHSYITLKNVKVRISGEGNYNTHLVSPDLAADAALDGKNSVIIYYVSNIAAVRALDGKVIDEIKLINNGYRTDQNKWNFNFLGTADDIKVTLTPQEIITNVKNALNASFSNAYYTAQTLTLPTESQGATIAWASNNEALINPTTGAVVMPSGAAVDVKLTATITVGSVSDTLEITTAVGPLAVMNIADFNTKPNGYIAKLTGVVTGVSAYRTYTFEDSSGATAIFSSTTLEVGKKITIVGRKDLYNGLHQIKKVADVDLVIEEGTMPPVVVLPSTVALTAAGLMPYQNKRLTVGEFTITAKDVDKYNNVTLTLTRGTEVVKLKWDSRVTVSEAAKTHINGLTVEQKVNLVGAPLGWNNGPLFGYENESQIVVVAAADPADQANEVAAALSVPETITDATPLALPTSGNYGAVIGWVSSHPEVIKADGTVVMPAENMTVTLTATVTVGTAVVSKTFDVRVKAVAGMEIVESYELAKDAAMELTGIVIATADVYSSGTLSGLTLFIQDGTAAISAYRTALNSAAVGDKVKVTGKKDIYNGLHQFASGATVVVLSSGNTLPEPTLVAKVADLVATFQSRKINMNGLTVVSVNGRTLTLTDGTTQITVRSAASGAEYDHLQTAIAGQTANIKGMLLGWYNGAQFSISAVAELELVALTDEQKVDADMAATTLPANVGAEGLTLPATGAQGSAITWASSNTAIIGNDGKIVAQPSVETNVTFTGTFVSGSVTKTKEYVVAVAAAGAATEQVIYETGFEADQGFTAATVYNNTDPALSGPAEKQWSTVYGTPSTTAPLAGAQSMQMRWYAAAPDNKGYTVTAFNLANISKVEFNAANTNGINVIVSVSKDGGVTWEAPETFVLTTSSATYTYVVAEALRTENMRIKFEVTYATAPTATSRLYIDDVKIYGMV